jgi:YidC/Oxa1 family membrane protein insertase
LIHSEEWLLEALHSIGLGWGLAIIGLTLLVRMSTVPLVVRQLRAQRDLKTHMPELKRLRERHEGDAQRLQRETAAYYREHGIKPLAALAPLLIQVPVFISLYCLMRTDVKSGLFREDGFLFIPHLASKPHGVVLAALLASYVAAQVASSAIATRALGGGRRGLMLMLPLLFASVVARVPAGLGVYWVASGLWGLGQQVALWRTAPTIVPAPVAPAPVDPPPGRRSQPRKRKPRRRGGS